MTITLTAGQSCVTVNTFSYRRKIRLKEEVAYVMTAQKNTDKNSKNDDVYSKSNYSSAEILCKKHSVLNTHIHTHKLGY